MSESTYRRYLDGDDAGLYEIIKEYRDPLVLFLTGVTGDAESAEECAEETFFILAAKRPRFRGGSSFKTWLYAIAKNTAYKEIKRRMHKTEMTDDVAYDAELEASVIKGERERIVVSALKKLPKDYREALYLKYVEDMPNGDVARVMKKNKKQIENLLARAKTALRQELTREGFTYENL